MTSASAGASAAAQRLVALDVDGTLLTSDYRISPRTRAALHAAAGAGWHVVLVTGRPLSVLWPVIEDLGVGEYAVTSNGATVTQLASRATVFQSSLPGAIVASTLDAARLAVPGLGAAVTTRRGFFREPGFGVIAPLSESEGERVDDARPDDDDVVESIVMYQPALDAREVLERVRAIAPADVVVTPSGLPGSVELTEPGVHKGSGLARLCELVGVAQADVVAFGDGLNDQEMLGWSGHGVAMGNAEPEAKAAADEVTTSNDEDGVALVIERLLGIPDSVGRTGERL